MDPSAAEALVRALLTGPLATGRAEAPEPTVTPDYHDHADPDGPRGPEALAAFVTGLHRALVEVRVNVDDVLARGDHVVARYRLSGVQREAWRGHPRPPTTDRVEWSGLSWFRIADGRLAEHWGSLGPLIAWADFERVDLRAGTVRAVEPFPEARKPAWKLRVDFGPLGDRWSSAQITTIYQPADLLGRQVLGVLNFPRKKIGPFWSEVLTTGFYREDGAIVLARPDRPVPDGARLL
jgi:tRNA-binding protein